MFNQNQEEYEEFHAIQEQQCEAQLQKEYPGINLEECPVDIFEPKMRQILITMLQYDIEESYSEIKSV